MGDLEQPEREGVLRAVAKFIANNRIALVGVCVLAFGIFSVYATYQLQDDQNATQAQLTTTQAELIKTQQCVTAFLSQDSTARAIRSKLVEDESANNRFVIKGVLFDVKTRAQLEQVKRTWLKESDRIVQARKDNPLLGFDEDACSDFIKASAETK